MKHIKIKDHGGGDFVIKPKRLSTARMEVFHDNISFTFEYRGTWTPDEFLEICEFLAGQSQMCKGKGQGLEEPDVVHERNRLHLGTDEYCSSMNVSEHGGMVEFSSINHWEGHALGLAAMVLHNWAVQGFPRSEPW